MNIFLIQLCKTSLSEDLGLVQYEGTDSWVSGHCGNKIVYGCA